jgi:large subunit ribosomal protein L15
VGSGKGKTAGRGHKGSGARNSRGLKPWFMGGQTPLYRIFPKRGFKPPVKRELDVVNLDSITAFVRQRRIDASQLITIRTLVDSGCVARNIRHGVKLLANGYRTENSRAASPPLPVLHLELSDASLAAKQAVEAAGGSVKLVWHNREGLRWLLKREKLEAKGRRPPRCDPIPPPRWRRKYAEQRVGGERVKSKMGDVL